MSRYTYAGQTHGTLTELETSVTNMKATLDGKPTTWCVVKPMINPRTINIYTGDVIGYDSGEPLTDIEINELSSSDNVYNVYSINDGDNFTEVAEADVAQKVRAMRASYSRWLTVNKYYDNEEEAVMNVTNEDMSGYV
tara:strand:- start:163 stop:576 length:414 start_codon:yes stop_codon:yes gene_type:complete